MYDNELTLISYIMGEDEIGNETKIEVKKNVLCKVKDIGSSEFYNAQVANLKPSIKFIIHSFEYSKEIAVQFEGVKYQVIRTFQGDTVDKTDNALNGEEIELTCEKVL